MLSIYININNIEMLQKVARVFTKFTIGITFGAIVCYTIVPPPDLRHQDHCHYL